MTRDEFPTLTFQFGIRCIRLSEVQPKSMVALTVAKQLIRSATSVGANCRAAIRGKSRADFIAKMGIVEEECDEALHWIDVLLELGLATPASTKDLGEANEILAITVSSIKTGRRGGASKIFK